MNPVQAAAPEIQMPKADELCSIYLYLLGRQFADEKKMGLCMINLIGLCVKNGDAEKLHTLDNLAQGLMSGDIKVERQVI